MKSERWRLLWMALVPLLFLAACKDDTITPLKAATASDWTHENDSGVPFRSYSRPVPGGRLWVTRETTQGNLAQTFVPSVPK